MRKSSSVSPSNGALLALFVFASALAVAHAQAFPGAGIVASIPTSAASSPLLASATLPDSPGAVASSSSLQPDSLADALDAPVGDPQADPQKQPGQPGSPLPRRARAIDTIIPAGQIAPALTVRDKLLASAIAPITPFALAGDLISAGYSQGVDSSPNYGTNATAFGQRLGAAVARGASQNLFAGGVMASVLHEDARYYQLGPQKSIVRRGLYAGTRSIITRTDSGKQIPNFWLLSGYLGSAFLTPTYYPPVNQSTSEVFATYGGSIGGASIGFLVDEFLPQALEAIHLKKTK